MEARNDEKGLAACYVRQKEALKHYIASRIDRPDEAEDVVQMCLRDCGSIRIS